MIEIKRPFEKLNKHLDSIFEKIDLGNSLIKSFNLKCGLLFTDDKKEIVVNEAGADKILFGVYPKDTFNGKYQEITMSFDVEKDVAILKEKILFSLK